MLRPCQCSATRPRIYHRGVPGETRASGHKKNNKIATKHQSRSCIYHIQLLRALINKPQLYVHILIMYIEFPHDSKPIPQPSRPCPSQATCVNPLKTSQTPLNSTKGSQHHCPPYDSGYPQTRYCKGKKKINIKKLSPSVAT